MRFTKMHGLGNDYVYINGFEEAVEDPARLAIQIADRHFGVGGDGLILVLPPDTGDADLRMRMFNADGSEAEMCGNGIRCVAKYARDHGLVPPTAKPMRIETGAGLLSLDYALDAENKVATVTVDMGAPILEPAKIPVDESKLDDDLVGATPPTFVSMGNPHAVFYVDAVTDDNRDALLARGRVLEKHRAFPNRMNIHFVQVHADNEVTVLHWERGSGPTLACGTGACAVAVAGVLTGKTARSLLAHLPGGDLHLEWREADNHVYMTGPATEVFSGDWPQQADTSST